jgi:hypothetical protein
MSGNKDALIPVIVLCSNYWPSLGGAGQPVLAQSGLAPTSIRSKFNDVCSDRLNDSLAISNADSRGALTTSIKIQANL